MYRKREEVEEAERVRKEKEEEEERLRREQEELGKPYVAEIPAVDVHTGEQDYLRIFSAPGYEDTTCEDNELAPLLHQPSLVPPPLMHRVCLWYPNKWVGRKWWPGKGLKLSLLKGSHPFLHHKLINHPLLHHKLINHPLLYHKLINHPLLHHQVINHPLLHPHLKSHLLLHPHLSSKHALLHHKLSSNHPPSITNSVATMPPSITNSTATIPPSIPATITPQQQHKSSKKVPRTTIRRKGIYLP